MTKIKGFFTFIVLAAVLGVGFLVVHGNLDTRHPNADEVKLGVTFTPEYRDAAVLIKYAISGVPEVREETRNSPWERTLLVPKGAEVVLAAFQDTLGRLTCTTSRNGIPGETQVSTRTDGVMCVNE
jgi:hypothetical protein